MSYAHPKLLFSDCRAETHLRPTSPAPSSLRPGSPAHAHSPLHNDLDASLPSRLVATAHTTISPFVSSPGREPVGSKGNNDKQAQTASGRRSTTVTFTSQRRPTTQRRHTSVVVLSSSLPPTSSSSPIPTPPTRRIDLPVSPFALRAWGDTPNLGTSNSGARWKGEATLGRRASRYFEGAKADINTSSPPPPPIISTASALVQYTTAGTIFHGPTTIATPTTALQLAMPDLDSLPPQPFEVLILAITTAPGPEESQSFYSAASQTPYSSTPHTPHPPSHHHPTLLANQLARQLGNPMNQPRVGAGPIGASGSALVGAGVPGEVIKSLRKAGTRGAWDVVAAWVERSGKLGENGARRSGETGAEGKGGGTTIERALL
ncbi:hypothetical protein BDV93DRAFT_559957 [Ceratobasidium sp. AG-I]|nr:hypothetical protein BDV93DRAFT_559957 [Ceratobasidium sp. AG-I]